MRIWPSLIEFGLCFAILIRGAWISGRCRRQSGQDRLHQIDFQLTVTYRAKSLPSRYLRHDSGSATAEIATTAKIANNERMTIALLDPASLPHCRNRIGAGLPQREYVRVQSRLPPAHSRKGLGDCALGKNAPSGPITCNGATPRHIFAPPPAPSRSRHRLSFGCCFLVVANIRFRCSKPTNSKALGQCWDARRSWPGLGRPRSRVIRSPPHCFDMSGHFRPVGGAYLACDV